MTALSVKLLATLPDGHHHRHHHVPSSIVISLSFELGVPTAFNPAKLCATKVSLCFCEILVAHAKTTSESNTSGMNMK